MDPMLFVGAVAVNAALILLWWSVFSRRETSTVDLSSGTDGVTDLRTALLRESAQKRAVQPAIDRLGRRIGSWTPAERLAAMRMKIARAGLSGSWTVERLLAMKVILASLLGALGVLLWLDTPSGLRLLIAVFAAAVGWFVPTGLLDSRVGQRSVAIRAELADTIDQLGVMVRAGMGIDGALARTAASAEGPIGEELARAVQDMRVGVSRTHALTNMAERVDVPELKTFVTALAQAESLGVPVVTTLQVQSEEMRIKRRQLAEEQAMKLPVKILFPMVFCILPTLFIVLLGPAFIRIMDQLGS